ncbi:MAG: OmpA family protein [Cytophagaceae bacterium]|nr:OmpA family protein [Cytophagaceae bacterium]MDW8456070.1 OmpA family protein [Cytophagaceae bacterium]
MNRIAAYPYKSHLLVLTLFINLALFSCVSKKKYNELTQKKSRLEAENANCQDSLFATTQQRDSLMTLVKNLLNDKKTLMNDTTQLNENYRKLDKDYQSLSDSYEKLLNKYSKLQNFSAAETQRLANDLLKREKELMDAKKETEMLQASLKQREARLNELEKILADKEKATNELKNKVSKALLNFKDKDLTVNIKNGKVYVSLSEQLLFQSGSIVVDKTGEEALKKLALVLKEQDDISIMVEGHTDDVPVAKGIPGIKDNWDLSVLRATSITRILLNNGVSSKNIIPAGRGEFAPIDPEKTSEARKKNRRTEIILTPKLDELFSILENN